MRTRWRWVLGALAVLLVLAYAVAFLIDEPLRRTIERQMNARMKGYTARIGYLNFHPIGFSVDLRDLVLVQDAHPDPPIMRVPRLSASVKSMNDLLRAHAKFDVASGVFSVFSELHVKNGRVDGYVKPLFRDLDVYDAAQDEDKSFGQKLQERTVDVIGKVLRNRPREEVATVAPIAGPLDNPKTDTWESLVGLVRNAFFKAILPGFERERRSVRR